MQNNTRIAYNSLLVAMATGYAVANNDTTKKFAISIPKETQLNDAIVQSSEFLNRITVAPVTDTTGQALRLGINQLLAKRTDTSAGARIGTQLGAPSGTEWTVKKTEFDVAIGYELLDQWARLGDLRSKYMPLVYNAIALDRMSIGFHGTSAAAVTDSATYPLGQDVNVGWLELLRVNNPSHYLEEVVPLSGAITIGETGDYKNLDALVADLYASIPVEHRTGHEVAIVGSELVANDTNKLYSTHGNTPSEKQDILTMQNSYGGLPAMQVSKFHPKGVVVTDPKNLHLYYQEGRTRRSTREEDSIDTVVDYIASNDAYAIGNLDAIAAAKGENISFV